MAYISVDGDRRWVPDKKSHLVERLSNWGISRINGKPIRRVSQTELLRRCRDETRKRTRRANLVRQTGYHQLRLL